MLCQMVHSVVDIVIAEYLRLVIYPSGQIKTPCKFQSNVLLILVIQTHLFSCWLNNLKIICD